MKNPSRQPISLASPLTVSYKAPSRQSSESMFLMLPGAVMLLTPNWEIADINDRMCDLFGCERPHLQGRQLADIVDTTLLNGQSPLFLTSSYDEESWQGPLHFKGLSAAYDAKISSIYSRDGQLQSMVLFIDPVHYDRSSSAAFSEAENKYETVVESLSEGVILMAQDSSIETFNHKATEILGVPGEVLTGMKVNSAAWKARRKDGTSFPPEEFPAIQSLLTGREMNDVVMGLTRSDGSEVWISINSRPIFREGVPEPCAVVASFKDITSETLAWKKVQQSELLFRSFMGNSPSLAWVYDEKGNLVYANPLFISHVGLKESDIGRNIYSFSDRQMADRVMARNHEVLKTGMPVISEDVLRMPDGRSLHFLANWFLVSGKHGKLIGGHAIDITGKINAEQNLRLMHERFTYVVNASSDAIWDLDLRTGFIYRSDAFNTISGYAKEEAEPSIDWWGSKIHPEDRDRVGRKIDEQMNNGLSHWEDEYRFLHADGTYRYIYDKGYTVFENGIAVRQVGSMQDITERKRLEAELLNEQVQQQKKVNQAAIQAQEHERNAISAELHDNVNQLLISSRLFIGIARNTPEKQDELLDKATNYLLMAVDEIRALSKRMNSKVVSIVGLKESITEIANNMKQHREMDIHLDIDQQLSRSLSPHHQLMIFRIVQEQTGNIIKHSGASQTTIHLSHQDDEVSLVISDNGQGFDPAERKGVKGIGMINIANRVNAYNGKLHIVSSPGNGCRLEVSFPVEGLSSILKSEEDMK